MAPNWCKKIACFNPQLIGKMNGTLALKEGVPLGDAMGELVDSETLAFEDKLIEMLLEGLVTNFTLFCGLFTIIHH